MYRTSHISEVIFCGHVVICALLVMKDVDRAEEVHEHLAVMESREKEFILLQYVT